LILLERIAKYLVIGIVLVYVADLLIFEVRHARGGAMNTVLVGQYLSTALKGNKAEYDYMGTIEVPCASAVFPQYAASRWNSPCWWLERHRNRWE
jgi:hypothetical protein